MNWFFIFLPFVTTLSGLRLSFGCFVPGDAHLIVTICLLMRLSPPGLASHSMGDKRFHPVQRGKRAKVTLAPEEATSRGNPPCQQEESRPSILKRQPYRRTIASASRVKSVHSRIRFPRVKTGSERSFYAILAASTNKPEHQKPPIAFRVDCLSPLAVTVFESAAPGPLSFHSGAFSPQAGQAHRARHLLHVTPL